MTTPKKRRKKRKDLVNRQTRSQRVSKVLEGARRKALVSEAPGEFPEWIVRAVEQDEAATPADRILLTVIRPAG